MLGIVISLSGWIVLALFVSYTYFNFGRSLLSQLLSVEDMPHYLSTAAVFFAPLLSSALGHLVNERTKLNKRVMESEGKYRDFFHNAPDGYHTIGHDGTILEVNDTWLKMLGYERDEIIGRMRIADVLTEEGMYAYLDNYPAFITAGHAEGLELDFRKKDGTLLPVIVNMNAIYDSKGNYLMSRSIVRDNSSKKRYEEMLIRASDNWKATFDSMPYGVMLLDSEFNILRANDYVSRMSGVPVKQLIGNKCYKAIHKKEMPILGCQLVKNRKYKKTNEFEFYEPEAGCHYRAITNPFTDETGNTVAYVHSLIDITDIRGKEAELRKSRDAFFNMLQDATDDYRDLKDIQNNLILSFANAIDAKSPWTKGHSERVTAYAVAIAKEMGLGEDEVEVLKTASLLHDIGKLGTYDEILNKFGKLTAEEFELVKMHPAKGAEILRPIRQFKNVLAIIISHHERMDGKGYPEGVGGTQIPLLARILHVADSYDAMTAERPYKASLSKEYAVSELTNCSGTQFDPDVVKAFLRLLS